MLDKIIKIIAFLLNAYNIIKNPFRYIISWVSLILAPYLVYVFWGSIVITGVIIGGIILTVWFFRSQSKKE